MRLTELLHLVWLNITENKFKVILTSLGIIVGAATIVMVIAIGRGGQADVEDQFKNLSAGAIDVVYAGQINMDNMMTGPGMGSARAWGSRSGGGRVSGGGRSSGGQMGGMGGTAALRKTVTLDEEDVEDILLFVPDVEAASISASTKTGVTGGNLEEETQYTVAGVKPAYQDMSNLTMAIGDFITEDNDGNEEKVCILGYSLALEIFDTIMDAYDSTVYIDGRSFTVNGVLSQMGSMASGISPDTAIFVPYSTAKKYVMGSSISPQITVIAGDVNKVPEVSENIETVLTSSYTGSNFTITDAGSKMEAATQSAKTLSMLLIAVASIVFIVGGIGIMNVLFVSVQERTREIGILKALGSSRHDILLEFLLEANMISTFGGVAGIGLSFGLLPLVRQFGMRVEPSMQGWVMALVFAILTGTVFGFYPAMKASKLIPIEALNAE